MTTRRWILALALALSAGGAGYTTLHADINATLTDKDKAEIKALLAAYAPALIGCKPEAWADLYATPGGYFASGPRGEIREHVALMQMVLSYDRCDGPPREGAPRQNVPTAVPSGPGMRPVPQYSAASHTEKAIAASNSDASMYWPSPVRSRPMTALRMP